MMIKKTEKCLVCILAQVRAHELTWDSFEKFVLDPLNADLALCIGVDKDSPRDNGFYRRAKYIWEYPEPQDYDDAFNHVKKDFGSNEDWRILLKVKDQWLGGVLGKDAHPASAGILIFYRWLLAKKILANGLLEKYDRFIVTRSDFLYCAPHPPLKFISRDNIWLPSGEDYGGYTDRHLVASNEDIIKCINIMDDIILRPKELYEDMKSRKDWNLEKYIAYHMRKNKLERKIRRFPHVMFTVRGKKDKTRWREGDRNEDIGLIVKYKGEFDESYGKFCKIIRNDGDWKRAFFYFRIETFVKRFPLKNFIKKRFPRLFYAIKTRTRIDRCGSWFR